MLPKGWEKVINDYKDELTDAYFVLKERSQIVSISPPLNKIMKFLYLTPLNTCSVVIVGFPDFYPYNSMNVRALRNISTELSNSAVKALNWTKQGVLLVNTSLTVEKNNQRNHDILWRGFIRRCIQACSNKGDVIFLLWGTDAAFFERDIDTSRNTVLKSFRPVNKEFIGHFHAVNQILISKKLKPVDW